ADEVGAASAAPPGPGGSVPSLTAAVPAAGRNPGRTETGGRCNRYRRVARPRFRRSGTGSPLRPARITVAVVAATIVPPRKESEHFAPGLCIDWLRPHAAGPHGKPVH